MKHSCLNCKYCCDDGDGEEAGWCKDWAPDEAYEETMAKSQFEDDVRDAVAEKNTGDCHE